ncbi:transposase [Spirosoma telluris]|uniref:transposase n=1 Tax=Spirosoma telluris TaxID=2183553 RepID=UPI0018DD4BBB
MQHCRKTSHTTYDCKYHIVWITKYRKQVLVGLVAERVRELLRDICKEHEILRGVLNPKSEPVKFRFFYSTFHWLTFRGSGQKVENCFRFRSRLRALNLRKSSILFLEYSK